MQVGRRWMGTGLIGLSGLLGLTAGAQPAGPAAATMKVSGYQVKGNTLLSPSAVDAVLLPMLGQRTLDELQRAAAAVQLLYAAEGYGAVVAYLPPQSGSDGLVVIEVVEGKVSTVSVTGATRTGNAQVLASLPSLQVGRTPRLRDIDAELRIANENPARNAQVLLKPGQKPGETEAHVAVQEQPPQSWTVGLDNTGNSRTGGYRASLGWQHASLTGHDDVAGVQLQTSPTEPSKLKVISGAYRWPLYGRHMVIEGFAAWSDISGANSTTQVGELSFAGSGRIAGVRLNVYLSRLGDFDQRLSVGWDRRAYLNDCRIAGLPAGACGPAGESVTLTPLSLEWLLQSGGLAPRSLSLGLAHNLPLGGRNGDAASFDASRAGARRGYTALRFNASAGQPVLEDWQLNVRLAGQVSGDALVSGEQFGAGGSVSVRGYEEREVTGDRGVVTSVELTSPPLLGEMLPREASLRLVSFLDAGLVANVGDAPCADLRTRCSVVALGVGARYAVGRLQARLDLAYPLKDAVRTQRGDTRAHLAVNLGF